MTNTTDPQRPEVDDPRVLALATARQQLAHRNPFNAVCPPWDGLSEQEQHLSLLDARSYLHAAMNAGLVPDATAAVSSSGRAALLHETADRLEERNPDRSADFSEGVDWALDELRAVADEARRVAAEEQPAETQDGGALMRAHVALAAQAGRDQRAVARVRQLHDALAAETALTSPDDEITRGADARKIARALDGERAAVAEQADTQTREARRCPAKHGALGRICKLPLGHPGMHTGSGPNGGAVWDGDAP